MSVESQALVTEITTSRRVMSYKLSLHFFHLIKTLKGPATLDSSLEYNRRSELKRKCGHGKSQANSQRFYGRCYGQRLVHAVRRNFRDDLEPVSATQVVNLSWSLAKLFFHLASLNAVSAPAQSTAYRKMHTVL
jgi:hypothetical protein